MLRSRSGTSSSSARRSTISRLGRERPVSMKLRCRDETPLTEDSSSWLSRRVWRQVRSSPPIAGRSLTIVTNSTIRWYPDSPPATSLLATVPAPRTGGCVDRGPGASGKYCPMRYRRLGRTDLDVSVLALGCGNFGGIGSAPELFERGDDEQTAFALMDAAREQGITLFDTANSYGGGRSEEWIGRWLDARPGARDDIVLTTKVRNR